MPKNHFLSKKKRIDRLIGLLKSDEYWTAAHLADLLSVSPRTVMRDLNELAEMGIPVETERGRGGGLRIDQRFGLGKLELHYKEIIDLLLALAIIDKLQSPLFLQDLKSIRDKLARAFPEGQRRSVQEFRKRIYIGDHASKEVLLTYQRPVLKNLSPLYQSFFEKKQLKMVYTSEKKQTLTRVIEPHYLFLNWPVWYILAWDLLREDIRSFRIDRIKKSEIQKESFKLHFQDRFKEAMVEFFSEL